MDKRKALIAKNIESLRKENALSKSEFARRSGMTPPTLATFLKYPEERNITLDHLYGIVDYSKIEIWNLFVEDFPFKSTQKKPITKISAEGYSLLYAFEKSSDETKMTILNQMEFLLQKRDKNEASAKYLSETRSKYSV